MKYYGQSLVGNCFKWDNKEDFSTYEIFKAYLMSQVVNGKEVVKNSVEMRKNVDIYIERKDDYTY